MSPITSRLTWNKLKLANIIAVLKSFAVSVYVTKDTVAARVGSDAARAKLRP